MGAPAGLREGRLPADVTSFVGRRRELGDVKRLLSELRLVTVTGGGGVGKTRLALRVAAEVRRAFPHGVWFVGLSSVRDPDLLSQEVEDPDLLAYLIAAELGLREQARRDPLQSLAEHLATRSVLLVLDNCEHVVPACAVVVSALLQACPRLRILATSREPLSVSGESVFAVPPLSTPDPDRHAPPAELLLSESVALFAARAVVVDPDFQLAEDNCRAVAGICHRLDGVPLAIELAAARLRALSPQQILDRLADRFALLTRGCRAGPDRQQTLRACVDWSFESCTKQERLLWTRLAVFVGGCELDAVEGVCADDQLPEADVLDEVARLVDKSVLVREGTGEVVCYHMLETIREYGLRRLSESGDHETLRRRHLDWYQQLAARARVEWVSAPWRYWLDRLWRAQPNLRAAVDFCLGEVDEPEEALRLLTALPWLWWFGQGAFGEGRRWLGIALARADAPSALRARALLLNANLSLVQGETDRAMRLLEEGDRLARQLQDPPTMAFADSIRGLSLCRSGYPQAAIDVLTRARDALSGAEQPDADLLHAVLARLGQAAAMVGDRKLADTCQADMLAITGPGPASQQLTWVFGQNAWLLGDIAEANKYLRGYLRYTRKHGIIDRYGTARALEVLAWVAASERRHRAAARLLGAAETMFADIGAPIATALHLIDYHHACEQQARHALGRVAFDECIHKGQTGSYEDAIAYALGEQPADTASTMADSPAGLTRREREVAELIAQGHSNKEVAADLVISQRTAETHVEHILTKLGFTSRTQVAVWVAAQKAR
ncbi:ATP-binding protein [Amycolatopsis pigmentata]|uniref:ATP-binding protein n=1 Tax=Amycolatopsis pigmentata TaxID=450801 RepID=A0ABW5FZR8_9PSEU